MNYFLNISNHASANWSAKQMAEAEKYGTVIDMAFPCVNADATEEEIASLSEEIFEKAMKYEPRAVMCQGEFTLSYRLISLFLKSGVKCLAACTERKSDDRTFPDGTAVKTSVFEFVRFREYRSV